MDITVQVASLGAIVAITTVVTPVVTAVVVNRNRRNEKQEDYARQDLVAARVEASTKLISDGQKEAASLLIENNKAVAATSAETQGQLKIIHTLVNSSLTEALQSSLDDKRATLLLMQEIVELKRQHGNLPTTEVLTAIAGVGIKIDELVAKLADRMKAAAVVKDEQKVQAAKAAEKLKE